MRFVQFALPFVCLLAVQAGHAQLGPLTTISLQNETANNTSACRSNGNPVYCQVPTGGMNALPKQTSDLNWNNNPGAQTHVVDTSPTHVSPLLIKSLMPQVAGQNWNGKVLCLYEPWFSVNSGTNYNSHIDIDYDENPPNPQNNRELGR